MKYKLSEFTPAGSTNVYRSPRAGDFAYTDGDEIENRIREILRHVCDKSTSSEELVNAIVDWPTEYHFSRERGNLLRHIQFNSSDSILELGAGCGSITRQLGESGARVTAVEGSMIRAECASLMCQYLPNVKIFCENFENIIFEEQYDYITLIGVLEYAPLFFKGADPIQSCLQIVKKYLKPGGKLLLAIENKLGLKYFMGCSEDHTGIKYFGIEGRYNSSTAITFGREELNQILFATGFKDVEFSYPFPDYKVPTQLYFEPAFNHKIFKPEKIIAKCRSRDYLIDGYVNNFDEAKVWSVLRENNLVRDLSNSFFVVASPSEVSNRKESLLAITYQSTRKSQYCVQTRFENAESVGIKVSKELIFSKNHEKISHLGLNLDAQKYETGDLLSAELKQAVELKSYELFSKYCNLWLDYVKVNGVEMSDSLCCSIKPQFIDCIPQNLVIRPDKSICFIDREWIAGQIYSLNHLLLRGLYQLQTENGYSEFLLESNSTFSRYTIRWMSDIGMVLKRPLVINFLEEENRLVNEIYGVNYPAPVRLTLAKARQNSFDRLIHKWGNFLIEYLRKINRRFRK